MAESKQQREVLARKVVTAQFNLADAKHGEVRFEGVSFQPDEVIVRSVVYGTDGAADWRPISLWTSLVGDFLCTFTDMSTSTPQTRFPIKVALSGHFAYVFTQDVRTKALAANAEGICVLTLEFVQHGPGRELD